MSVTRTLLVAPVDQSEEPATALEGSECAVTTANRATTAMAELTTGTFDCLVSTYRLPGDDGLSLIRAVRETNPELPIVLVTDPDDETIASDALSSGANRVIERNGRSSFDQLRTCVAEVTDSAGRSSEPTDISGHEPAAEQIVRVVDEAPIGITVSDPSLPDNPIVYVNDAWQRITGYDKSAVLGRSPRLLQGPKTDTGRIEAINRAIETEEPSTVELRNYRSDGSPFWNELTVAPIYDDEGGLAHFVGFQSDVTDRKTAEQTADEREAKLAEERAALEHVLARVNGLLNDIARVLVEERDRAVVDDRVCEVITDAPGYVASWLGRTNPAETRLELASSSGLPETGNVELSLDGVPSAVTDAIETGEPQCLDAGVESTDALGPTSVGGRRLLVVPLRYGEKTYGFLGVYAGEAEALDSRERQLFEAIGRMIANGLNAVETTRILTADRVTELEFEIVDDSFPLVAIADRLETTVEYVGLTTGSEDGAYELYLAVASPLAGAPATLTDLPFVEGIRIIADTNSEWTIAVTVAETPVYELAEYGITIDTITADGSQGTLTVVTPVEYEVRPLLELLESYYDTVELRSQHERDRRDRTPNEFASQIDTKLTDRQYTALETAQLNGYFEWPRPVDGGELAETMGISRQTFHQHLRAAERKLAESYFEQRDPH
ncbi:bacterio-opsin activator domain-containing protein [Natronorubrum sp. DTA7]|uniref:bacterio-opsin activator domain-containing protein n=1 Tax=Natronorubrum sp. DTA7 TaxID=3447016 RepID=UPI003F87D10F